MTTVTLEKSHLMAPPVAQTIQQRSLIIGAVGAVVSVAAAFLAPASFFSAYLVSFMDLLGLSLGCMAILMLYHLVGGKWGTVIRRILEAGAMTTPLMAILFLPILFNLPKLYAWAQPDQLAKNHELAELAHSYLNPSGIVLRAVIYFALWIGMSYLLTHWSTEQDTPEGGAKSTLRFRALSAFGILLYAFSISFAAIDWVMSLEAPWISTIYGLIFVAGEGLAAFCFCVVIESILSRHRPMSEYLEPNDVQDHGKFMITFTMLWAYFNFSQWLIIWSGNIPDEISWFLRRSHGGWGAVAAFLAFFGFGVPFAALLSRSLKRKVHSLVWLAAWVLIIRWLDLWWHIEPSAPAPVGHPTVHLSWVHFAIFAGMGGLWFAYFFRNLRARPLLAVYAPQTITHLESMHE
jgi:hypothetical protein